MADRIDRRSLAVKFQELKDEVRRTYSRVEEALVAGNYPRAVETFLETSRVADETVSGEREPYLVTPEFDETYAQPFHQGLVKVATLDQRVNFPVATEILRTFAENILRYRTKARIEAENFLENLRKAVELDSYEGFEQASLELIYLLNH